MGEPRCSKRLAAIHLYPDQEVLKCPRKITGHWRRVRDGLSSSGSIAILVVEDSERYRRFVVSSFENDRTSRLLTRYQTDWKRFSEQRSKNRI